MYCTVTSGERQQHNNGTPILRKLEATNGIQMFSCKLMDLYHKEKWYAKMGALLNTQSCIDLWNFV